jgi:predicted TPR repeat methyltransferase
MKKNKIDINAVQRLHQAGHLDQAKAGYLAILQDLPRGSSAHHALVLNNLGTIYFKQNNLSEAIDAYQRAIAIKPDYVDAYYNLGLALTKNNLLENASTVYQKLLAISPAHDAARFHLACLYMRTEKIDQALTELLIVEAAQPYHFETQTNLATCYLKKGALNEAKQHYSNALKLIPEDTQILFNLGVINMQQGLIDHAIQYYQRTLQVNPDLFEAHNNLGVAFLAKQYPDFALSHFKEALRLQPENKSIAYIVDALSQNKPLLIAPPDYIKSLFDSYADHYESHLLNALDYKIPQLFNDAVLRAIHPQTKLDILDLGCGTGLCGVVFKSSAKSLIGVDLSQKMLDVAALKKCYDELIVSDITSFLSNKHAQYDLILAGDTLVYLGELDQLFKSLYQALRNQGLFIFNTEISDDSDFRMSQSGRFLHNKKYIDRVSQKEGFKIIQYQPVVTRLQHNGPVQGHLYVLQK